MNLRVGDDIKVLSGQYTGMQGTIVNIRQDVDNVRSDDSNDVTWRPTDPLRAAFDVLVSVVGFGKVWFTPEQIAKVSSDKGVNLEDVTWEPTGSKGLKEPDHFIFNGKLYDYPKGGDVMYDMSLSKNTIWQLMVNLKNTLLYYKSRVEQDPQNNEIKELQKQRRQAAKELLDVVADRKEDFEPEFDYLSALIGEDEEE